IQRNLPRGNHPLTLRDSCLYTHFWLRYRSPAAAATALPTPVSMDLPIIEARSRSFSSQAPSRSSKHLAAIKDHHEITSCRTAAEFVARSSRHLARSGDGINTFA